MEKAISPRAGPLHRKLTKEQSIALVFFCTLISAVAQILFKIGARDLPAVGPMAFVANPLLALRNLPVLAGLGLYAVFMLLFVVALKDTELSIIYPVISFSYVWVALLSLIFFQERINLATGCGIAIIMAGVMILGKGGPR